MSSTIQTNLNAYCRDLADRARTASSQVAKLTRQQIDRWLELSALRLLNHSEDVLKANEQDVADARNSALSESQIDRLTITDSRLRAIAESLRQIATLDHPVGELMQEIHRPNGLLIRKVRVPLGVIFFIYESRPNVTIDAAAICVKSGNAVILRGGKEAGRSNAALAAILRQAALDCQIPHDAIQLVETTDRQAIDLLLAMNDRIDLAIPRGGEGLIRRVADAAKMPVLKHFDGNCHVFVDASADIQQAIDIVVNAKCQRMGVCNACESLLVHQDIADRFLPTLEQALESYQIELRADPLAIAILDDAVLATEEDWSKEYLGPILSVKIVSDVDQAIAHINRYGSHHTDAIVTTSKLTAEQFAHEVDSAAVMVNASTRFNDGGEFGMGAEIGISTDKFHARGPCGLRELTTYKYIVQGTGQIRD
jgi:glutamate-5-semialdehyde dehydrogenase